MRTTLRALLFTIATLACLALWLRAWGALEARSDPRVREATIAMPDWPKGAPPLRVVLISDIHIRSHAMDATRLERIVRQVDALHPDLVLIAGDFIYGGTKGNAERFGEAMVVPLSHLRAPLGVVAALGNHDHWTGPETVTQQLTRAGVHVLDNGAVHAGPLALGVAGDDYTDHTDLPATLAAMRRLRGARLILTHSPDVAPKLPADISLLLAGHTHCGQAVIPFYGAPFSVSRYGDRYRCGIIREGARTIVVTAGLGTSGPALRFNAPPDLWLLTLGPG